MIRIRYAVLYAIVLLFAAISLHADTVSGCVDSPEAPTVILMFIGVAGVTYGSSVLWKALCRSSKR